MILVDTSIWVDHLRTADEVLAELMGRREALTHPFVIGELAMGNIRRRNEVVAELRKLPSVGVAPDHAVMLLIDRHQLFGTGIGYIDAHLLTAARLAAGVALWTHDRRLRAAARQLGLATSLTH